MSESQQLGANPVELGANPVDNFLCKVCGHIGLTSVNPENPDLSTLKILALCLFCNG